MDATLHHYLSTHSKKKQKSFLFSHNKRSLISFLSEILVLPYARSFFFLPHFILGFGSLVFIDHANMHAHTHVMEIIGQSRQKNSA